MHNVSYYKSWWRNKCMRCVCWKIHWCCNFSSIYIFAMTNGNINKEITFIYYKIIIMYVVVLKDFSGFRAWDVLTPYQGRKEEFANASLTRKEHIDVINALPEYYCKVAESGEEVIKERNDERGAYDKNSYDIIMLKDYVWMGKWTILSRKNWMRWNSIGDTAVNDICIQAYKDIFAKTHKCHKNITIAIDPANSSDEGCCILAANEWNAMRILECVPLHICKCQKFTEGDVDTFIHNSLWHNTIAREPIKDFLKHYNLFSN